MSVLLDPEIPRHLRDEFPSVAPLGSCEEGSRLEEHPGDPRKPGSCSPADSAGALEPSLYAIGIAAETSGTCSHLFLLLRLP